MTEYYDIIKLQRSRDLFIKNREIIIQLDNIQVSDHVKNDVDFKRNLDLNHFFYISGGGTYLINERYLVVVKREAHSIVNAGRWSIFTGRASGSGEHRNPTLVLRELFEELLVYCGQSLCYPRNLRHQKIIDQAYSVRGQTAANIDLREVDLSNCKLTVYEGARVLYSDNAFISINRNNDINMIFLFTLNCDLTQISFKDGEVDGRCPREIALLDLKNMTLVGPQNLGEQRHDEELCDHATDYEIAEHLQDLVKELHATMVFD